jgi:hypothetical protein
MHAGAHGEAAMLLSPIKTLHLCAVFREPGARYPSIPLAHNTCIYNAKHSCITSCLLPISHFPLPPLLLLLQVGQYRKNTLLGVLSADRPDLGHLHITYRLDRPVSGLMVLARSSAAASRMRAKMEVGECACL